MIVNYNLTKNIKELIVNNPDLPIVVFVGCDASDRDYTYVTASNVTADIGEVCNPPFDEPHTVFTDREELFDYLYENCSYFFDGTDSELDDYINKKLDKYEPYWVKSIIIYVD
ncbi:MAG: hypothetical protein IKF91_03020 [Bacilli bacterium]|nr:hypothetical protein [Bacilli bacterium]